MKLTFDTLVGGGALVGAGLGFGMDKLVVDGMVQRVNDQRAAVERSDLPEATKRDVLEDLPDEMGTAAGVGGVTGMGCFAAASGLMIGSLFSMRRGDGMLKAGYAALGLAGGVAGGVVGARAIGAMTDR